MRAVMSVERAVTLLKPYGYAKAVRRSRAYRAVSWASDSFLQF